MLKLQYIDRHTVNKGRKTKLMSELLASRIDESSLYQEEYAIVKALPIEPELRLIPQPRLEKTPHQASKSFPSVCRYCQFYKSHGRSGGNCQQLGVPVHGAWRSCPLALPPFAPSWEVGSDSGCNSWEN